MALDHQHAFALGRRRASAFSAGGDGGGRSPELPALNAANAVMPRARAPVGPEPDNNSRVPPQRAAAALCNIGRAPAR